MCVDVVSIIFKHISNRKTVKEEKERISYPNEWLGVFRSSSLNVKLAAASTEF